MPVIVDLLKDSDTGLYACLLGGLISKRCDMFVSLSMSAGQYKWTILVTKSTLVL